MSYEDHIRPIAEAARRNREAEEALASAELRAFETRTTLDDRQKALREFTHERIAEKLGVTA